MSDLINLYQELIMDHGRSPRFHFKPDFFSHEEEGFNPFCGDKVHLYAQVHDDIVEKISFQGCGCAISMASTSLMLESSQKKSLDDLKLLFKKFHDFMMGDITTEDKQLLGKLEIFQGVKNYPTRVKCATLPWHTLEALLRKIDIKE